VATNFVAINCREAVLFGSSITKNSNDFLKIPLTTLLVKVTNFVSMHQLAIYHLQVFQMPRFRFTMLAVAVVLALSVMLGFLLQLAIDQPCATRLALMWTVSVMFWLAVGPYIFRSAGAKKYGQLILAGIIWLVINQALVYGSVPLLMYLLHGCHDQYNHWLVNTVTNNLLVNGLCFTGFVVAGRWKENPAVQIPVEVAPAKSETIPVKYGNTTVMLEVAIIYRIEVEDNCIVIFSERGKHVLYRSLSSIEKILPACFVRIHRSRIINKHYVQKISALPSGDAVITLRNGHDVRMSRTYRKCWKGLTTR
jgi:hypothetical protein